MGQNSVGSMNAPANFQRFMERCLGDLRYKVAIPYLFSRTFEAHVEHLKEVLRKHSFSIQMQVGKSWGGVVPET